MPLYTHINLCMVWRIHLHKSFTYINAHIEHFQRSPCRTIHKSSITTPIIFHSLLFVTNIFNALPRLDMYGWHDATIITWLPITMWWCWGWIHNLCNNLCMLWDDYASRKGHHIFYFLKTKLKWSTFIIGWQDVEWFQSRTNMR